MREFFIRLRIILISLLFIILVTAFLVFPKNVADVANELDQQESGIRLLLVLAALLADLVLLSIIYQELRPRRRTAQGLIVRSRGSSAEISFESVKSSLNSQIGKVSGVHAVNARVRGERGRVVVELDIDADETVHLRKKTDEIHREIVKIVERQLGLRLASKPLIKFRLLSEPAPLRVSSAAAPEEAEKAKEEAPKKGMMGFFGREKKGEAPAQDLRLEPADDLAEPAVNPIASQPPSTPEPSETILLASTKDEEEPTET